MKSFRVILIIGVIEILIGSITLIGNFFSILLGLNTKSTNVLIFVITAACVSTLIGIGILKFRKLAYQLLLYFSTVVILSKLLLFMDIINLNGALETSVPPIFKDTTSVLYHAFVIYYIRRPDIKEIFR